MQAKLIASVIKTLQPANTPYEVRDPALPGFLLRVQPSGVMTYYYAYRDAAGRKTRYRIGAVGSVTPAQARDVAEQLSARVIGGEDVQATKQEQRQAAEKAKLLTLQGFLDHQYGPWIKGERPARRQSTETLQRLHTNFGGFLERPLTEITPWLIEKWRAEQVKQGKARATINRDITALRAALSKAVAWHVIDTHPLRGLKNLRVDTQGSVRFLTPDEEIRLRTALAARDDRYKAVRARNNARRRALGYPELSPLDTYADYLTPLTLVALNTGLRRGELFNLRWEDVTPQTLTVRGATAKSGQTRHVPLNDEARSVLADWREQSSGEGYVFPGKDGTGRMSNIHQGWTALMHEAGITGFRFHDTRHHFASRLVMAGVPLYTVQKLLGHTTPTMTMRYAHLAPDHEQRAVNLLCAPSVKAAERRRVSLEQGG